MKDEKYFEAIRSGDVGKLGELLAADPGLLAARTDPDDSSARDIRCTGLHVATHSGQTEVARALLDAGIDVEAKTTEGRTALHDSIEFSATGITELLLARGAHVDLCSAAILGKLERVRELLDREPELRDDRSTELSPLGWASYGNQVATATELLDRGARPDDGELICAASVGHVEVGRLLIGRGADPNEIHAGYGGNALHAAAAMKYGHNACPFVEMLLEAGADPALPASDGRTALQIAEASAVEQARRVAVGIETHPKPYGAVAALLRHRSRR